MAQSATKTKAGWVLAICVCVFCASAYRRSTAQDEQARILAAINANRDDANSAPTLVKSFFDGLTFGATGGGDVFAEYNRIVSNHRELVAKWNDAEETRLSANRMSVPSLLVGTGALVVYVSCGKTTDAKAKA